MSNANETNEYDINDLVWAKMKGFPPWPGRVTEPTENMKKAGKKQSRCIFFFGSDNYAWIEVGCLKPYHAFKESLTYSCKTAHFKEACKAIEAYIQNNVQGVQKEVQNNGISESESRFDSLIKNDSPSTKVKITNPRSLIPNQKPVKKRANDGLISKEKAKKRKNTHSTNNTDILTNVGLVNSHSTPVRKNNTLLDRPEVTLPESTPLDVSKISRSLLNKNIEAPENITFGFIGLGNIGSGIVKNLLNSGHKVVVWNRTPDKANKFQEAGAFSALTPSDVVGSADITFSCVTDPQVVKEMVYGNCGILSEVRVGKSYVEMAGVDPDTSMDVGESVVAKGGRYLEAMVQGSKIEAEEGNLVIMAAGDRTVFDDCESAFCAMAKSSYYLGEVGTASKMNLVLNSIKAVTLAGLAEGMALADRAGLPQKDLLDILALTSLSSPLMKEKGKAMMDNHFTTNQALKLLQKDVCMTVQWSETLEQPCPVNATVNEVFKHAKRLGYSDHDTSSIYVRAKF